MKKELYVLGMGELLWDMLPDGKQMGGAPANFAYHAQQIGANGGIISAIGNDYLGDEILENVHKLKINSLISRVDYPTGTVKVSLKNNGIPSYEIIENVAWDKIPFTKQIESEIEKADAICFGSLAQRSVASREMIMQALNIAPNNCLKVFDINLRQSFYSKEIIKESIEECNVLKINDEELNILSEMFDWKGSVSEICMYLVESFDLHLLALTCGEKGSYLFTKGLTSYIDTPKVHVADTVGAGDSFTGAMIVGMLKELSLAEIHEMAVNVSAFVCTQKGATPKYQLDEIKSLIE